MTISQFSERTGLRPKLLRYYEEAGLILPEFRADNGYRQYAESQIETAQLVNSLRQAGVSMAGIREFLLASTDRKEELLVQWRSMAETKLLSVKVANQFLQGFDSNTKRMHLVHWECAKWIAWFAIGAAFPEGTDLRSAVHKICSERMAPASLAERAGYIRFLEDNGGAARGTPLRPEIGFLTEGPEGVPRGGRLETVPPTLFATMMCSWAMPFSCKPVLSTIRRFGFEALGEPLRKVVFGAEDGYMLMVPVVSQK